MLQLHEPGMLFTVDLRECDDGTVNCKPGSCNKRVLWSLYKTPRPSLLRYLSRVTARDSSSVEKIEGNIVKNICTYTSTSAFYAPYSKQFVPRNRTKQRCWLYSSGLTRRIPAVGHVKAYLGRFSEKATYVLSTTLPSMFYFFLFTLFAAKDGKCSQ